jgi:hypothetical protein
VSTHGGDWKGGPPTLASELRRRRTYDGPTARVCRCGHGAAWHRAGGTARCDFPDCRCHRLDPRPLDHGGTP